MEQVKFTNFLGVFVDEKLEWSEHILHVKAKMSSALYALNSAKHYLTPNHLIQLYNALIYPYLSYGILLWGSTFKTYIYKLVVLQKKALRIIGLVPFNSHTHDLFRRFKILKVNDIYNLLLGKYMFMQMNNILPEPLLQKPSLCGDVHSHHTRQRNKIFKQNKRTALVANCFLHKGPDYWNKLPDNITFVNSIKLFNKRHRMYLVESMK